VKAALNQPQTGEKDEPVSGVKDNNQLVKDQRTVSCRSETMQRRVSEFIFLLKGA